MGQAAAYTPALERGRLLAPLEHVAPPHVPSLMFTTVVHIVAAHCNSGAHATNQWPTVCWCCRPVNNGHTCTPVVPSLFTLSCQPPRGHGIQPDGTAGWPRLRTGHKGHTPASPFCSLLSNSLCHHLLPAIPLTGLLPPPCLPVPPPSSFTSHPPPPLSCLPPLPGPLAQRHALLYPPDTHLRDPCCMHRPHPTPNSAVDCLPLHHPLSVQPCLATLMAVPPS
jgi:hypothetical protein